MSPDSFMDTVSASIPPSLPPKPQLTPTQTPLAPPHHDRKSSSGSSSSSGYSYAARKQQQCPSPKNVYTHCGRHTDQYLFGGKGFTDMWRAITKKD
jgi:hypothetical protein